MTREDAVKLLRACAVLYYGADEEMIRLAENEFSGCASTQRNKLNELEIFLKTEAKNIMNTTPSAPNPIIRHGSTLGSIITKEPNKK